MLIAYASQGGIKTLFYIIHTRHAINEAYIFKHFTTIQNDSTPLQNGYMKIELQTQRNYANMETNSSVFSSESEATCKVRPSL